MFDFKKHRSMFNLQMFADGGGASEGGSPSGEAGSVSEGVAAPQEFDVSQAVTFLDDNGNPVASPSVNGEKEGTNEISHQEQPVDVDKEFHDLIKKGGKYADAYNKAFKNALDKRLSGIQNKLEKQSPVIDFMMNKYGITDNNVDSLVEKMNSDDDLLSELASDAGMSVDAYKQYMQTQRKLNMLEAKEAEAEQERQNALQNEATKQKVIGWQNEANQLKESFYPDFDLLSEMNPENPSSRLFISLLDNGFDMKSAYEAAHHDEFMQGSMQYVAQMTRDKMINAMRSGYNRPDEAAGRSNASRKVPFDVSRMTDEQLDEIDRMSRQGNITLHR